MKKIIFFGTLFLVTVSIFGLVSSSSRQTRDDLPIAAITPPNNNKSNTTTTNNTLNKDKEVERILTVLNSAKISNEKAGFSNQGYYKEVKYLTQKSQLTDLENTKLSENDKEIRIWNIETLFSGRTKGYIFTFIDGRWQGGFIVSIGKKVHFKKILFDEPLSGWKNWEAFVENEITPAKVESSNSQAAGTDGSLMVIEVKFGQKYAKNVFCNPSMTENTAANILRKLKAEFYNNKIKWSEF